MRKTGHHLSILTAGLAMFAMLFGAGNIVFPFILGQLARDKFLYALSGMVISAVGVPFLGFFALILYNGNWKAFFGNLGKVPSYIVVGIIMALIGPLGAIPRSIAFSCATLQLFFEGINACLFNFFACLIIFFLAMSKKRITLIIGKFLTPILLVSLFIIILKGLFMEHPMMGTNWIPGYLVMLQGLCAGYHTLDLLSAFFFAGIIITAFQNSNSKHMYPSSRIVIAVLLGSFFLALTYIGMGLIAALHSSALQNVPHDLILGAVAVQILGPSGAIIVSVAAILTCLTTAIALASIFADFLSQEMSRNAISYAPALIITMLITFFVANIQFNSIVYFLTPVITFLYPSLIVFTLCSIAHELWNFRYIKTVTAVAFVITVCLNLL